MVHPALLPLMRTPRLPVVDWTDAPTGRFKWTRPFRVKDQIWFLRVCHHVSNVPYRVWKIYCTAQTNNPGRRWRNAIQSLCKSIQHDTGSSSWRRSFEATGLYADCCIFYAEHIDINSMVSAVFFSYSFFTAFISTYTISHTVRLHLITSTYTAKLVAGTIL